MKKAIIIGILFISLGFFYTLTTSAQESTKEVELCILGTTDIHMHMLNYDYYKDQEVENFGLVYVSTLIKEYRNKYANCLLFDNGDLLQGNPMGDYVAKIKGLKENEIHPCIKVLNELHYDVAGLGNHEFNYGLPYLYRVLQDASYPVVCANITPIHEKAPWLPYVILNKECVDSKNNKHTIRIAVIGVVPPKIEEWDKSNLQGKVKTTPMVETVKQNVQKLRDKADLIIILSHGGLSEKPLVHDEENSIYEMSQISGIDGIIAGHTHSLFPNPAEPNHDNIDFTKGLVNNTPVVLPGSYASHLGVLNFKLVYDQKHWKVAERSATIRPISSIENREIKSLVAKDTELAKCIEDIHKETVSYTNKEVGRSNYALHTYFANLVDSSLLEFINAGQKWYVENYFRNTPQEKLPILSAAAPFKCGGRGYSDAFAYTDVPAGKLAIRDMANIYGYANTLYAVQINGALLLEWLEYCATQFNQIEAGVKGPQDILNVNFNSYNFDVIDGVTYEIDISQPFRYDEHYNIIDKESHRIKNLKYNGKPVTPDQEFIVATNNYRAGGSLFKNLPADKIFAFQDQVREVLVQFLQQEKNRDFKPDYNWKILPVEDYPFIVFFTSKNARKYEAEVPNIEFDELLETNFIQYRVNLE
jgi:2',3'-cyclic-nucleotide 2'-phosphodiesterase/3'-nucleotidase